MHSDKEETVVMADMVERHVIEHSGMQAEVMVWNITYRHAG
jgi:hypothetical protein